MMRAIAAGCLLLILASGAANAQGPTAHTRDTTQPPRGWVDANLIVAQPVGEFAQYVHNGFGFGGGFNARLDAAGYVRLRVDGSYLIYGHEGRTAPLSPTVPEVTVNVNTSNNIFALQVGPEFAVPSGAIRPYVNGHVGYSYFFTQSSVSGTSSGDAFASSENYSDGVTSWGYGGGVRIPLGGTEHPTMLDIGARYTRSGRTRYLREGSIHRDNGQVTYSPVESETNLVTYRIGISVGIR
jgi:hypothetical protein